jgi:hypothetical protein
VRPAPQPEPVPQPQPEAKQPSEHVQRHEEEPGEERWEAPIVERRYPLEVDELLVRVRGHEAVLGEAAGVDPETLRAIAPEYKPWLRRGFGREAWVDVEHAAWERDVARLADMVRDDPTLLDRLGAETRRFVVGRTEQLKHGAFPPPDWWKDQTSWLKGPDGTITPPAAAPAATSRGEVIDRPFGALGHEAQANLAHAEDWVLDARAGKIKFAPAFIHDEMRMFFDHPETFQSLPAEAQKVWRSVLVECRKLHPQYPADFGQSAD